MGDSACESGIEEKWKIDEKEKKVSRRIPLKRLANFNDCQIYRAPWSIKWDINRKVAKTKMDMRH